MRTLDPAIAAALARGVLARRNCIRMTARDRATGYLRSNGFWNDDETLDIPVLDGLTGQRVG